jgi:hypothetical protein
VSGAILTALTWLAVATGLGALGVVVILTRELIRDLSRARRLRRLAGRDRTGDEGGMRRNVVLPPRWFRERGMM